MRLHYIFTLLIILLLTFGCGGECKKNADCSSKTCHVAKCTDKECIYEPEPNCCGNKDCETGENKCTCSKDCGKCEGTADDYQYLTNYCDSANECLFGLDEDAVKTASLNSGKLNSDAGLFEIDTTVNQPFNVKTDILELKISLREKDEDVRNIRIAKIALIGENSKRQKVTLGMKEISRPLWSNGDSVTEDVPLTPKTSDKESELKNAQVDITITFDTMYKGNLQEKQDIITFKYPSLAFVYVAPDMQRVCPPESQWDDGNEGTEDECSASTDYFVMHYPKPGECGNYECDAEENRCTCPADCGPCTGRIGSYMALQCSGENQCLSKVSDETSFTSNTIFNEKSYTGFMIAAKVTHEIPFNLKGSTFTFEMESVAVDTEKVGDIKILDVRVFYDETIAMEKSVDQSIMTGTATFTQAASLALPDFEDEISLDAKIWVEYDSKASNGETTKKFANYRIDLDKIPVLNPGVLYK